MVTPQRKHHPQLRIREERIKRGWSQQYLADQLQTTVLTVNRWERGVSLPRAYFRLKLSVLFGKSPEELELLASKQTMTPRPSAKLVGEVAHSSGLPSVWNVPLQRNPFFTGREETLTQLHDVFHSGKKAARTQFISGLGGIGKTHIAAEYAYRFRNDYAVVLWAQAETREVFTAHFAALAEHLHLPEQGNKDQYSIIEAVKRWLSASSNWLLILDNVDDFSMVSEVVSWESQGHTLVTTRTQSTGMFAWRITLLQMGQAEGALLLLRRAKLLECDALLESAPHELRVAALAIVHHLDGLPLALDQAGSYIEETACSLPDYLRLFQASQARLLNERTRHATDHPLSVTKTFMLAFEQLQESNMVAAEILTACAFLAPEAIPEAFFLEGMGDLGPACASLLNDPLAFQEAIKALLRYSLLQRYPNSHTLIVHRLVQTVIKAHLPEALQNIWAGRVLHVMAQIFPTDQTDADYWQACERMLPHAQVCITHPIQKSEETAERISLMNHIATYLVNRARFREAEPLFLHALHMGEDMLNSEHLQVAETLHGLTELYREQGRYEEARRSGLRALYIREHILGSDHLWVAVSLNGLAILSALQGKYAEAESLFLRALHVQEHILGSEHAKVADILTNIAILYAMQGAYEKAEPFFRRVLPIIEKNRDPHHPHLAYLLNSLAELYFHQGKYEEAEPLALRALDIRERVFGHEHTLVAHVLIVLASIYREQGKYNQSGPLYERTLALRQRLLGVEHPDVAECLHQLAYFHQVQHQMAEALSRYQQALIIRERVLGLQHPQTCETRTSYTRLLREVEQE